MKKLILKDIVKDVNKRYGTNIDIETASFNLNDFKDMVLLLHKIYGEMNKNQYDYVSNILEVKKTSTHLNKLKKNKYNLKIIDLNYFEMNDLFKKILHIHNLYRDENK